MPFLNFDTTASREQISKIVKDFEARRKASSTSSGPTQQPSDSDNTDVGSPPTVRIDDPSRLHLSAENSRQMPRRQNSDLDNFSLAQDGAYIYSVTGEKFSSHTPAHIWRSAKHKQVPKHTKLHIPILKMILKPPMTTGEKYKMLIREYLSHRHGPIHISRTLDQFYYNSIGTDTRDLDQVVYRFSQKFQTVMAVESDILKAYKKGIELESAGIVSKPKDRLLTSQSMAKSSLDVGDAAIPRESVEEDVEESNEPEKEAPTDTGNPRIFTVDQM